MISTSIETTDIRWFTKGQISQLESIGCGNEGKVFKANVKGHNGGYCVKVFSISDEERKQEILKLIKFTADCRNENIVGIIGPLMLNDTILATRQYGYIMEYMNGGSLKSLVESKENYTLDLMRKWMTMVGRGLKFLCDRGILYRNIRPSNMLLTADRQILKLSDYGIRRRFNGKLKLEDKGFYCYLAPEVLSGEGDVNNPTADIYSLGIVTWELLHRRRPYAETMTIPMCEKIMDGERPSIDSTVPDNMKNFIIKCWSQDIKQRPTIENFVDFFKIEEIRSEPVLEIETIDRMVPITKIPIGYEGNWSYFDELKNRRAMEFETPATLGAKMSDLQMSNLKKAAERPRIVEDLGDNFEEVYGFGDRQQPVPTLEKHQKMSNPENSAENPQVDVGEVHDNFYGAVPKYLATDLQPYPESIKSGTFGTVTKVFVPSMGPAALKQLRSTMILDKEKVKWKREIDAIYRLSHHPNIIALYGYVYENLLDPIPNGILMEFMSEGNLYEHILKHAVTNKYPTQALKDTWAKQIALGLSFIHSLNMMHRDFKPDNILLCQNRQVAKIAGFSCSRPIDPNGYHTICVGNPMYAAPEVYMEKGDKYRESADVWSYAMVLYFIYYEKNPYEYEVLRKISPIKRIAIWKGDEVHTKMAYRPALDDKQPVNVIIQECWKTNPEMRCSMTQVVNFFNIFYNSEGVQLFPSVAV